MNFIKRPIARSRLKKTNPLYQRIDISRTADQISVKFDNGKPVFMPVNGKSVKWTRDDGEVFDVSGNWQDSQLLQTFAAEDGQRVNTFSLSPDGKTDVAGDADEPPVAGAAEIYADLQAQPGDMKNVMPADNARSRRYLAATHRRAITRHWGGAQHSLGIG